MDEKKFNEILNGVIAGLSKDQKAKVSACKNSGEVLDLLSKMGVALPDELLDEASGGFILPGMNRPGTAYSRPQVITDASDSTPYSQKDVKRRL